MGAASKWVNSEQLASCDIPIRPPSVVLSWICFKLGKFIHISHQTAIAIDGIPCPSAEDLCGDEEKTRVGPRAQAIHFFD